MKINRLFLFVIMVISLNGFAQENYPFFDTSLSIDARINDLIGRLTLDEKAAQMMNSAVAIPRLNIPAYDWWNEALHGLARSGVATVYPQTIALSATFDQNLVFQVANSISDEARANYNAAIKKGYHLKYSGLTFWTPNVNIFRDPRWGRGQETYGEDPYLTGMMGASFVHGLQGSDINYLKTSACAKHFAVHSGPEKSRHEFDAVVSKQDLFETYLPAFKSLVDAGVESVMGAYNRTNGELCNASDYLIDEVLRKQWGFKGHIVTDCGALVDFYKGHNVVSSSVEAAALAVQHGINLNCGNVYKHIPEAVMQGLISEEQVDQALAGLLKTRFKLGLFDEPGMCPFDSISYDVLDMDQHTQLAYEAAVKSVVLLKNNGILPLNNGLEKYFVTGPHAGNIEALIGNYYGVNQNMVTILEGIAGKVQRGSQVQYQQGCLLNDPNSNPIDWVTGNARNANATIVVLGVNGLLEGEEGAAIASSTFGDVFDYSIPANQIDYLKRLRKGNNKPIISVVIGGCPLNLSEVHELSDAVLMAWYPGQEGGNAVADIIFGNVSPSGKLPVTFPKSLEQLPPYDDYSMAGRTYRYMDSDPMYPFGFGLSYSSFVYESMQLSNEKIHAGDGLTVKVKLKNRGNFNADEVVQLYLTFLGNGQQVPKFSLKRFARIKLNPNEEKVVVFNLNDEDFSLVNDQGIKVLNEGKYRIAVGGTLPVQRSLDLGASQWVQKLITIE